MKTLRYYWFCVQWLWADRDRHDCRQKWKALNRAWKALDRVWKEGE